MEGVSRHARGVNDEALRLWQILYRIPNGASRRKLEKLPHLSGVDSIGRRLRGGKNILLEIGKHRRGTKTLSDAAVVHSLSRFRL